MLRLHLEGPTPPEVEIGGCAVWDTIASLAVLARFRVRGGGAYAQWAQHALQKATPELVRELWRQTSMLSPPPPGDASAPDFSGVFDAEVAPLFEAYWQAAIGPYWDSMELTLRMEAQRRSETLVSRGWVAMLGSIDPRLQWRAPQLASPHQEEIDYAGDVRRLRLVPLMFGGAWTLFTAIPIGTTSLSYALPAAHALRSLQGVREQAAEQHDPLTILLGARRAGILRYLQHPATTTMVSAALGIAPSTTSEHLRALLAIGAVRRVRRRNEVFYELDRKGFILMGEFS